MQQNNPHGDQCVEQRVSEETLEERDAFYEGGCPAEGRGSIGNLCPLLFITTFVTHAYRLFVFCPLSFIS